MIVAGFGCRASVAPGALLDALHLAWGERPLGGIATAADRAPMLAPIAATLGLPLISIDPDALAAVPTPTRSAASLAARGTGSVAEAAALAAAGPGARLIVQRVVSSDRMATCAIAEGIPS